MGSIPADYRAEAGELLIAGKTATRWVGDCDRWGLFVYDMDLIRHRVSGFKAAMPSEVSLHYAIKANPYMDLLKNILVLVDGFDVASQGEMEAAISAGMAPEHISMAGPGKRDTEIAAAVKAGITLNLESESEAERALSAADAIGVRPKLAIRVNPDFEIKGSGMRMGGGAKPFGIDAERVPALVRRLIESGADWRGFHIFAGSQALDPDAIIEAQRATVALAAELAEKAGASPPLVNLGGGFGIPYFSGDLPLNIESIGERLGKTLAAREGILADSRFAIELGRWLVGEAGVYLTRIVDRKVSHGETFLIVDGGLHHQLAASGNFGTVVRRNYPIAVANRFGAPPEEEVSVVGCLCTPLDRLGDRIMLPKADVGDIIAVFMAGAYGATASPQAFLGHPPPEEILVDGTLLEQA